MCLVGGGFLRPGGGRSREWEGTLILTSLSLLQSYSRLPFLTTCLVACLLSAPLWDSG